MTIILFLVDTSSSMCQKAFVNGVQKTYLDIAKGAVETFLKFRQRTQDCLGDRYMLLTFEEPPANIKAGWKENHATFMNELKNLQSNGLTTMGESLKNAFDLLNLNRMQSGIDTYGQGRCPFYLEPSVIIVITDGGRYSYRNGVHPEIILPLSTQIPGTKFTKEPFRWDQRLFSLVLRMSGNKVEERIEGKVQHDDSPIERMCEVTGGRSYRVRSHFVLNQCLESLVQKVQPGVILQFEPMLPKEGDTATAQDIVFQPTKKMIYVQKHIAQKTFPIGYWPLPEPYWPDPKALSLHPRDAHPKLKVVTTAVEEPQMVRSFPVDKYEVEACPLTFQIIQKRELTKCWQVIISNGMHGFELPFGYLKASPNFTQVHLYVLAYNYPALLPLLNDLIHKYNMSPPNDLMYKFNAYVRSIPPYYCPFLRKALHNINVPYPLLQFLLPENVDNYLSPNIANQLKLIKNTAKQDQENLCMKVFKQLKQPKPPYRQIETTKLNTGVPLRRDLVRHPLLRDTFAKLHAELEPIESFTVVIPQLTRQPSAKSYRNPFDIPRRDIIEEIARMRESLLRPTPTSLVAKDSGHCLPISEMGNYQEYLKHKDNPLREIEPSNVRQHMFGNPYKKDKHMVMVDEADLSDVAPIKAQNNNVINAQNLPNAQNIKKLDTRVRKRKAGPIRKDYIFKRAYSNATRLSLIQNSPGGGSLCPSPTPSMSSYSSDYDEDSMSDTASVNSDESDPARLVMSFDFNEEENVESEFPLNGYVRNFINGMSEEAQNVQNHQNCDLNSVNNVVNHNNVIMNNNHITLAMNSNGNLIGTGVPTSPPNSPQHPYINNFVTGGGSSTVTTTTQVINTPQQSTILDVMPPYLHNANSNGLIYYPPTAVPHLNGGHGNILTPVAAIGSMVNNAAAAAAAAAAISTTIPMYSVPHIQTTASTLTMQQQQQQLQSTQVQQLQQTAYPTHQLSQQHQQTSTQLQQHNIITTTPIQQTHLSVTANAIVTPTIATATTIGATPSIVIQQQPQQQLQIVQQQQQHLTTPSHNDINDAQEISRILQQCHNGNIINNNHNNNNNNNNNNNSNNNNSNVDIDVELMPPPIVQTTNAENLLHNNNYDEQTKSYIAIENMNGGMQQLTTNSINNQNHNSVQIITTTTATTSSLVGTTPTTLINQEEEEQQRTIKNVNIKQSSCNNKPTPLTEEQRNEARKHNMEIRTLIFRDIRRPGRNYTQLLDHLNLLKGDLDMKAHFVDLCIYESQRFRRQQMVKSIQDWWKEKKKILLTPQLMLNSS